MAPRLTSRFDRTRRQGLVKWLLSLTRVKLALLGCVMIVVFRAGPQSLEFEMLDHDTASKTAAAAAAAIIPTVNATPTVKIELKNNLYYNESQIIRLSGEGQPLAKKRQTVVTAYFKIPSKHTSDRYNNWMKNMLSLQDPMVIFISPEFIDQMKALRAHALDRTVLIPMDLNNLPLAQKYSTEFWQHQLDIDPEKKIHRSYYVFWIWLSKLWWTNEAIRHNFFQSDIYVWSDIGCFRSGNFNGKEMVQHPEQVPRHAMLQLAHHKPNPPRELFWNDKYKHKPNFYHSGSQMAAYNDTFIEFYKEFQITVEGFLERKMFIGEDQTVLQSTCNRNPNMCVYIPYSAVKDNNYFGLRTVLRSAENFTRWYPPPLSHYTTNTTTK